MECDHNTMRLYAVTDRAWSQNTALLAQTEAALQNGVTCVQLREKQLDAADFLAEARDFVKLCHRYNVPLIINDNIEVARESGADGVHLGQGDRPIAEARALLGPGKIVGLSAHSVAEAVAAQKAGADYIGIGAVFGTSTKADARPLPFETLADICRAVTIPKVAIGGINEQNILRLAGSGVDGVAVVSAIFAADDPGAAARRLAALSAQVAEKENEA